MTTRTIVVVPDTQIPFEAGKELRSVLRFIGDYQPDEIIHIGDLLDFPQPSRWNKDKRGEFEGSVYEDAAYCEKKFLRPLREVYDGPVGIHEGNHDERPRVYLEAYSPALAGTKAFDFDVLCHFEDYNIKVLPVFNEFAPGWLSTHGHRGQIHLNSIAGRTAFNGTKKFTKNIVMGHTHRLGASYETHGYDGKELARPTGIEVGNLMDMRRAQYLKGGTPNWQQGFAVLRITGRSVEWELVPIVKGQFRVEGVHYGD